MSMMDIVIILVAVAIVAFGLVFQIKRRVSARKMGVSPGCASCGGGCSKSSSGDCCGGESEKHS